MAMTLGELLDLVHGYPEDAPVKVMHVRPDGSWQDCGALVEVDWDAGQVAVLVAAEEGEE